MMRIYKIFENSLQTGIERKIIKRNLKGSN